jgi:peptide/nickel transport system substrate-binding protein
LARNSGVVRRQGRLAWSVLVALAAVVLTVSACSSSSSPTTSSAASPATPADLAPAGTATLNVVPLFGAADTWNPYTATQGFMWLSAYSQMLNVNTKGQLVGYLAKSWTATPSKITFTLKPGITCSDGHMETAADVAASFENYVQSKSFNITTNLGRGPYKFIADNAANTVTVELGTPYADAIYAFDDQYPGLQTSVICPAGLAALKANPKALDTGNNTYGTGPYVVSHQTPGGNVTMKLRPDFAWGPNGITSKTPGIAGTINYQIETDVTTAANLVQSGGVNLAEITGPDADRLKSDSSLSEHSIAARTVNPVFINQAPGRVASDIKVRQALITAIDPKQYVAALGMPATLSSSIVTSNVPCFDSNTTTLAPTPSVSAATKILEGDGWTMSGGKLSKNGKPLALNFPAEEGYGAGAEYMANAWQQMGATVNLQQVDSGTWVSRIVSNNYDVTLLNNKLDLPTVGLSAQQLYAAPPQPAGTNFMNIANWRQLQQWVFEAESMTGSAACGPLKQVQASLWTNWNTLPLYGPISTYFGNGADISQMANIDINVLEVKMLKG